MNKKENLNGAILHATDLLKGSYFEDAVILIAVHDENGTFGLMLNRPTHMPINEVFNPVPEVDMVNRPFYVGGPVDEEGLHLLHLSNSFETHGGLHISDGVELGGEWGSIEEILESNPSQTLLFLGYSGWDSGQLAGELEENSWDIYRPDVYSLLVQWPEIRSCSRGEMIEFLQAAEKS